ncbi:MAG: tRNA (adenosine(37)-N6)-threonylcarbamoyltransferase complex dimerization subunit type 1 TsaB [Akkermansia sp.]
MNILAIECSQAQASLCLMKQGEIQTPIKWETARNHDSYLFPGLESALNDLGEDSLDVILVGAGPGSYGGVRVAIAAASGISMVKGCKLAAIDSWAALARGSKLIISDAKRGGWTLRQLNGSIEVKSLEEMLQLQSEGSPFSTIESQATLQAHGLKAQEYNLLPTAQDLIETWMSMSPEQQEECCQQPASPIYVRPPHITKAKRKPWECKQ